MTVAGDDSKQGESARLESHDNGTSLTIAATGAWTVRTVSQVDAQVTSLSVSKFDKPTKLDISGLTRLDTAGAWLIYRLKRAADQQKAAFSIQGASEGADSLIKAVAATDRPVEPTPRRDRSFVAFLARLGQRIEVVAGTLRDALGFAGLVLETLARSFINPAKLRITSLVYHMEQAGLNAVPIVCLMSFLIGAVLAFQGAEQLQRFGAEPYTVNLVAVSFLREVGILLTAIMVAGRSGSAFTAQIGSMKMREEIDAIRTLGLDPIELLVLPRVLALVITLPLLGFISDMMGLLGGGVICWATLDISPSAYLSILRTAVDEWGFWVGIIKAPVFAFLIGVIGCFEGMRVTGTAESVGQRTTQSVVEGIFTVIVADAFFSIVFQELGI